MEISQPQARKHWWGNERVWTHEALPTLFVFTIWETRNKFVFKNTWTPSKIMANVLMQKLNEHQAFPNPKPTRNIKALEIDKNKPWGFFDGARQGETPLGGAGGILYLNEDTRFEIKFALRQGINNKAELVALWAVLKLAQEKTSPKFTALWGLQVDNIGQMTTFR